MAQEGYSLGGKGKNAMEGFCRYYHGKHKNRGVSYDSECPICNGHFDKFFWLENRLISCRKKEAIKCALLFCGLSLFICPLFFLENKWLAIAGSFLFSSLSIFFYHLLVKL